MAREDMNYLVAEERGFCHGSPDAHADVDLRARRPLHRQGDAGPHAAEALAYRRIDPPSWVTPLLLRLECSPEGLDVDIEPSEERYGGEVAHRDVPLILAGQFEKDNRGEGQLARIERDSRLRLEILGDQ